MDYGTITLAFIALLLLYILYTIFFVSAQLISNPVDLHLLTATELVYDSAKLKNPGSTRYSYEAWIYIDANAPGTNNVLFHRGKFFLALNGSSLKIYTTNTQPGSGTDGYVGNLSASRTNVYTPSGTDVPTATITNTFPFQRWAQVAVNVDGSSIDIYLEGQLVQTISANFGTSADLKSAGLGAGNAVTIGKLKDFIYKPTVISPQDVYNSYMRHNSVADMGGFFSKYGIDMSLLKNNENLFDLKLL
jgi:hypothetical protein